MKEVALIKEACKDGNNEGNDAKDQNDEQEGKELIKVTVIVAWFARLADTEGLVSQRVNQEAFIGIVTEKLVRHRHLIDVHAIEGRERHAWLLKRHITLATRSTFILEKDGGGG